jgi:hypothetical protein
MPNAILDGLSLIDPTGQAILAINLATLCAGVGAHVWLRGRYAVLQRDLDAHGAGPQGQFDQPVLRRILREAEHAARRSVARDHQAIVEDAFASDLRSVLLAERFVRAATGLVLVIGLLGTFYGLTVSIGRLVHLVAADTSAGADVAQALTQGLTQALSGMAAAFSNSLVGVAAAVVLTLLGVVNNVTDLRTRMMLRLEAYLDEAVPSPAARGGGDGAAASVFGEAVLRLEATVARFEGALQSFAANTRDLREVQLVVALKPPPAGERR